MNRNQKLARLKELEKKIASGVAAMTLQYPPPPPDKVSLTLPLTEEEQELLHEMFVIVDIEELCAQINTAREGMHKCFEEKGPVKYTNEAEVERIYDALFFRVGFVNPRSDKLN